jgi:transcription termination/antitermination protein NusG
MTRAASIATAMPRDAGPTAVSAASAAAWFAVWTRNQCESKVAEHLRRKSIETFLPAVAVPSRRRDRCRVLARPLFPGYLFVRAVPSREAYIQIAGADGVVRLLGERWDALHRIPDADVDAIRRIVSTSAHAHVVPWIRLGDRVRIIAGPLAGLEGFVQAQRDRRATFVVSIDLLQRSVGVEMAAEFLERA